MDSKSPIGVFDSGLGGISVLSAIHTLLPGENLIYFGDSQYNPYGTKTKEEITQRCLAICDELIRRGAKMIVVACNTATSACVNQLRDTYDVDIIGMEPALKVACDRPQPQRVAVWATDFTLKEEKFAALMHRFDEKHEIHKVACPQLVRIVEEDDLDNDQRAQAAINAYLAQAPDVDSIVLGCTHFVFFKQKLAQRLQDSIELIDGNEGTARHVKALLEQRGLLNRGEAGTITWMNTLPEKIGLSKRLFNRMEDSIE
ncbi:glutamate racemase [uncultured Dubosiella sp.]|uniref:glutamate racemase n=1 Tax=uncultured Dubosiella sp. TaxID=1937011 RepID=UPI0027305D6B|nr:glutamate racemase [uncultured Dubosiella sp.]